MRIDPTRPFTDEWCAAVNEIYVPYILDGDRTFDVDVYPTDLPVCVRVSLSVDHGGYRIRPLDNDTVGEPSLTIAATALRAASRLFGTPTETLAAHTDASMTVTGPFKNLQGLDAFLYHPELTLLRTRVRAATVGLEHDQSVAPAPSQFEGGRVDPSGIPGHLSSTQRVIDAYCGPQGSPALQLYVSRRGEPVIDAAFGEGRPGRRLSATSNVSWYCCSKPLVAIALASAWEQGHVDLDAPLCERLSYMAAGGKHRITPFDLLTHTTGLSDPLGGIYLGSDNEIRASIASAEYEGFKHRNAVTYAFTWGWFVLADLLEEAMSQPWPEFVYDNVLRPLGADNTVLFSDGEVSEESPLTYVPKDYGFVPGPLFNDDLSSSRRLPGMNTRGPMSDLGRVLEGMLGCGKSEILSRPTLSAMTARHRVGLAEPSAPMTDWGLGFELESSYLGSESVTFGDHCDSRTFGHRGLRTTLGFGDPEHELVVAMHFNGMVPYPVHRERVLALSNAIYEDLGLHSRRPSDHLGSGSSVA